MLLPSTFPKQITYSVLRYFRTCTYSDLVNTHVLLLRVFLQVEVSLGSGVLTIRLTGFTNPFGRTYDGACCDPTPRDRGSACYDQCDYVMRLIVTGLGRYNKPVFCLCAVIPFSVMVLEGKKQVLMLTLSHSAEKLPFLPSTI